MRRVFLSALILTVAGCATAPPGADVGERLRSPEGAVSILAAYDQEAWLANSAFSRTLNEPVSGLTRKLAEASEMEFMGYVRPPAAEQVVNAEIGPVDDMSRFYVVSNVVESSTVSMQTPGMRVVVDNNKMVLASSGVPVYIEEAAPQFRQAPPQSEIYGPSMRQWEQPAQRQQAPSKPQWQRPYYYYPE